MINKKIKVAVIGATGYTGLDLVFLLTKHPKIKIEYLCATKNLGKNISFFDQRIKKKLPKLSSLKKINWSNLDIVFLSLPNGEAQKIIKDNYRKYNKIKFIDLSADFRITNSKIYYKNYKINHKAKNLIKYSLYSISELRKKVIKNYRIISNPGCYPTSIQIPLIPIIKKDLINNNEIIIDSKSGYSGAGKNYKKKFSHKNFYKSTFAYKTSNHRHVCEIEQELTKHSKKKINITFNPHLLPTFRGLLSTIYVSTKNNTSAKTIRNTLVKFYKGSKFIRILKLNAPLGSGNVLHTNNCEISVCETKKNNKIIILSAIDNLIKGAAGQAIQNMNILCNYSEKLGLK